MDVNGTRFHLLLGKKDWLDTASAISSSGSPPKPDMAWNEEKASLTLRALPFRFPTPPGEKILDPEDRKGAGLDRYGNWYWIDKGGTEILFLSRYGGRAEHFFSSEDMYKICQQENDAPGFRPLRTPPQIIMKLSGLAVTDDNYLVAGTIEPAGLLIFDLYTNVQPIRIQWSKDVPFKPFDMAPASDGGVWILDMENARYWKLDKYFVEELSSSFEGHKPVAIEALPDGTVLILDKGIEHSKVYRFCLDQPLGSVPLEFLDLKTDRAIPLGYDIAFLTDSDPEADRVTGTLYVVCSDGNQAYAFEFRDHGMSFSLELLPRYFPMRLFSGRALVAHQKAVYYDLQDRWLPITEQSRLRYREQGVLETQVFDGKEVDCIWHRLFLDACIPPGAEAAVESKAADDEDLLAQVPWEQEPLLYLRYGADLPYYQAFSPDEAGMERTGTWELLFQQVHGRYMKLRITIRGTGRNTPWLRALRVYYPRFSYLKEYLPDVYQDDKSSASFLDRFLANMEGIYTGLEGRIEQAQTLFDVRTTAKEYLDWVAGWLGVVLDPAWDETRRRLFLSHAVALFQERGTVAGLIHAIRLSIDPCPDDTLFEEDAMDSRRAVRGSVRIVERYLTRSTPGVVYGDPSETEGPGVTTEVSSWTPSQGAEIIHQRYRDYLEDRYKTIDALNKTWGTEWKTFGEILFSPVLPEKMATAEDWRKFTQQVLGFTYAVVTHEDEPAYRAFLVRRYLHVAQLNQAYHTELTSFEDLRLPAERDMPSGGKRLYDWIQFVSLLLPISRNVHRFTVLIPADPQDDTAAEKQKLDLVKRIIELEKPAHTDFDVKLYWEIFRVGEARLGLDTVLDMGSRYVTMVLGKVCLMQGFLAPSRPWDIPDRVVVERDKIDKESSL